MEKRSPPLYLPHEVDRERKIDSYLQHSPECGSPGVVTAFWRVRLQIHQNMYGFPNSPMRIRGDLNSASWRAT